MNQYRAEWPHIGIKGNGTNSPSQTNLVGYSPAEAYLSTFSMWLTVLLDSAGGSLLKSLNIGALGCLPYIAISADDKRDAAFLQQLSPNRQKYGWSESPY